MGSLTRIKILLVDDNHTFLNTVQHFLAQSPEVEVIGQAYDAAIALQKAALLRPDLVLMDIAMPGANGLEAATAMNALSHPPQIVFLSMHDGSSYREAARDLGARGFVSKSELVDELMPLISSLLADKQRQMAAPEVSHGPL